MSDRQNVTESAPAVRGNDFSAYVQEKLGWYVYLLRDPRDGVVFYVGKGIGNRCFAHAKDAVALADVEKPKLDRIRAIHGSNAEVDVEIVRHGLSSERAAYEVEAAVLDAYRAIGLELTNEVAGHHSALRGWASAAVVASLYDAPPARDIGEPVIIFKLPKLWYPGMTADELYDATSGWWRLARHKGPRARYALAVSRSVVRAVYRIERWRERVQGDRDWKDDPLDAPRLGFYGHAAVELADLLNTSVARYFKPGQQGLRYLNCDDERIPPIPVFRGDEAAALAREEGVSPAVPLCRLRTT